MAAYRWRLARPSWLAAATALAAGIAALAAATGSADDAAGTLSAARRIDVVLAAAVAAALRDQAAAVHDATPRPRWARRLAPAACALTVLGGGWLLLACVQSTRVRDLPWAELAVEAAALTAVACAAGLWTGLRTDPGLTAGGALALLVLTAETTPLLAGRRAWILVALAALAVATRGLRDPARRRRSR
ncbi:hypothetical protein [Actinoplanes sp. RD1]|uniref:hypothetical protein n=1 Tax=Actinoplanes sp. RD1 TaxID=3064538 RepID=UPI002741599A|nr:hypothetical protein [Actinoplanes sp. RD1]